MRKTYDFTEELKANWLARLRTGKKARNRLRNTVDGMCCLGHLADELEPDGWKRSGGGKWRHDGFEATPVFSVWLGDGGVMDYPVLARWNDTHAGFPIEMIEALPTTDGDRK